MGDNCFISRIQYCMKQGLQASGCVGCHFGGCSQARRRCLSVVPGIRALIVAQCNCSEKNPGAEGSLFQHRALFRNKIFQRYVKYGIPNPRYSEKLCSLQPNIRGASGQSIFYHTQHPPFCGGSTEVIPIRRIAEGSCPIFMQGI